MIRVSSLLLLALGLAACSPTVPDSGTGVGFQDYNSYIRNTQAAAQAAPVTGPLSLPAAPAAPVTAFNPAAAAAAIDRAEGRLPAAPLAAPALTQPGVLQPGAPLIGAAEPLAPPLAPVEPVPADPAQGAVVGANPAISDEQDFAAVSARESIESDKARIDRNRQQYVVVQPGALPSRPGDTGPNIVQFALATTHAPGTPLYSRRGFGKKDPSAACARFGSPDIAQEEFLSNGGPERDRAGVDPDGDGFACNWDPRPFRTALN